MTQNIEKATARFRGIPFSSVPQRVKNRLAQCLDIGSVHSTDYRDLAEKFGFSTQEITHIPYIQALHGSNTLKLFDILSARGGLNGLYMDKLVTYLYEMKRIDAVQVVFDSYKDILERHRQLENNGHGEINTNPMAFTDSNDQSLGSDTYPSATMSENFQSINSGYIRKNPVQSDWGETELMKVGDC